MIRRLSCTALVLIVVGCAHVPFTPTSNSKTGGAIVASEVSIPRGVTLSADRDLVIYSTGDLRIDGEIVASASRGPGVSITLISDGDVSVSGAVKAGDGFAGSPMEVVAPPPTGPGRGKDVQVVGNPGR